MTTKVTKSERERRKKKYWTNKRNHMTGCFWPLNEPAEQKFFAWNRKKTHTHTQQHGQTEIENTHMHNGK